MSDLGVRLNELMNQNNVKSKELADYVGQSEASISKYRNGKNHPTDTVVAKFAQFFDVSTDYLILGHEKYKDEIEILLIEKFRDLSPENKNKALKEIMKIHIEQKKD